MRRWMLGGFVTLALLTGACGGDDDESAEGDSKEKGSGTREEYVEAFQPAVASIGADEQKAQCGAEAIVDTIGVDPLNDMTSPSQVAETGTFDTMSMGIEVDEPTANALYDAVDGCVGFYEMMLAQTDPSMADCLRANLAEDTVRNLMIGVFMNSQEVQSEAEAAMTPIYTQCAPTPSAVGDPTATTMP